jgi:hypothetical protein
MSTPLPSQHTRAMQVAEEAQSKIEKIRARTDLVPSAKAERVMHIYSEAAERVAALRAEYEAGKAARHAGLQRRAFGVPTSDPASAGSYRDAIDRFGKLRDEPHGTAEDQALVIMERAARAGDQLAIRAAANVAFDRQWSKATARACELVPAVAEHMKVLEHDRQSRLQDRMRDDAVFNLPMPAEISQMQPRF